MIRIRIYLSQLATAALLLLATSCVDPYHLETNTFEDALVIEATITNELKLQKIKLSRTFRFEDEGPTFEENATVVVSDSDGNNYTFIEADDFYESDAPFQAVSGRQYTLRITTSDGKTYSSSAQTLTAVNPIESLEATVVTNSGGVRGVQIGVNSFDPTAESKYYRFEYAETYKVIAPEWSPSKLIYNQVSEDFEVVPRTGETQTCYSTDFSNTIILANTNEQAEDRLSNFPVRFVSNQDYIISHRYSILVRQYVQNLASYTFYKTMKEVSGSGSLLSQNQPGFFEGNIRSEDDNSEKVIGFFDVSSVSEIRTFFNYADLFPGEPLPPYFDSCEILSFETSIVVPAPDRSPKQILISAIEQNSLRFHSRSGTIYYMVVPPCGDCTSFSSNIIPPFWQ